MIYDLAIVGGGPAGTSAALTAAAHGLSVVLCERSRYDVAGGRDKVCGEFISAEAVPLLAAWTPALLARAPVIETVQLVSRRGREATFALPQLARGLSRLALDAALWQAAVTAGVAMRSRAAVAEVRPDGEGYVVCIATGDVLRARRVIWAAGRQSASGRSRWVGVKARFCGVPQQRCVALYALRGGYCGVAPVEGGLTNICCLLRADQAPALEQTHSMAAWLAYLPGGAAVSQHLQGAEQATATVVTAGIALGTRDAVRDGMLVAGDASGFIDPFTGDGIARALLSGQMAANAVADGVTDGYPHALRSAVGRGFRAGAALRAAVLAPAWAQALALSVLTHRQLGPRLVTATRWHRL